METDRYTTIGRYDDIVDTFVTLTRHSHEVTLCFEDTRIHYPVSVVSVDRSLGTFLIDITSLGDVEGALAEDRAFVLHALQSTSALVTTPTRSRQVIRREDRLALRCWLPAAMTQSQHRSYFRAVLGEGTRVEVALRASADDCRTGVLCDLSVRGCLLSLPMAQAVALAPGDALYQLCARFPNGETFEAYSRVIHVTADESGVCMHVGVAFDMGFDDKDREVWFYVSEIEREVARQSDARSELRPLAPSRLFHPETDTNVSDS
ncbi:PilZ domain-containing protein [Salinisphaera aquimarina]|uniref:PilZ domain-containing protein n=1 Tax=Salinisphaera aquimarina TaxID=2094031 RepID=A0ABV7EX26_9GAMM